MNVAICGYPPLALQIQEVLKNSDIKIQFFIEDLVNNAVGGENEDNFVTNLPLITFFEFRRLVNAGELDGVIIADDVPSYFTKNAIQIFKFYRIPQVGIMDLTFLNPNSLIYWLDEHKSFLHYLEADITDRCNLNCRGCCHFANFYYDDEFYPLENFKRDMCRIAQIFDIPTFRLLGGEPFILKNVDDYLGTAKKYFPNVYLGIITNGLLIPSLPQKTIDTIRKTKCTLHISVYPPTAKIFDKIKARLDENSIPYKLRLVKSFWAQMTLNAGNDPVKAMKACRCGRARSLRNGKIYKCPIDAASYKFVKKFGIEGYSSPTGVDIYSPNCSSLIQMLDDDVELCHWCSEKYREFPWSTSNKPQIEDYLSDPDELKNFA